MEGGSAIFDVLNTPNEIIAFSISWKVYISLYDFVSFVESNGETYMKCECHISGRIEQRRCSIIRKHRATDCVYHPGNYSPGSLSISNIVSGGTSI